MGKIPRVQKEFLKDLACARLRADLDARVAEIIRSAPLNRLIPGPDKSPEDLATEIRRAHAELAGHSDPTDRILLLCHPDARSDLEPVVAGLPPGGYRVVETETILKDEVDVLFVPGRHPPATIYLNGPPRYSQGTTDGREAAR